MKMWHLILKFIVLSSLIPEGSFASTCSDPMLDPKPEGTEYVPHQTESDCSTPICGDTDCNYVVTSGEVDDYGFHYPDEVLLYLEFCNVPDTVANRGYAFAYNVCDCPNPEDWPNTNPCGSGNSKRSTFKVIQNK